MINMRKILPTIFVFFLLFPEVVFADGAIFIPPATGEKEPVDMDSQMAAIVIEKDGYWNLYIRPHYSGDPTTFAWVIPFPVKPDVDENPVDEKFFKDLDEYTATMFWATGCYKECNNRVGCGGQVASESMGDASANKVIVWESGKVGVLDYIIISSVEGSSLVDWLQSNGFVISDTAEPLINTLTQEGSYFFAARVSPSERDVRNISPVHFRFPPEVPIQFPMRLTSVSNRERIKFYIWVIDRNGANFVPLNYPSTFISGFGNGKDELSHEIYELTVNDIRNIGFGDTFIVKYSTQSRQEKAYTSFHNHQICAYGPEDGDHNNYDCGFRPASSELKAILGNFPPVKPTGVGIVRLEAEISPAALTKDLFFRPAGIDELANVVNWYWETCETIIDEECSCSISTEGGSPAVSFLVAIFLLSAMLMGIKTKKMRMEFRRIRTIGLRLRSIFSKDNKI